MIVQRPWTRQPVAPRLAPLRFSRNLVAAFVPMEGGPGLRDYVSGVKAEGAFPSTVGTALRYSEACSLGTGLFVDGSYVTWQAGADKSPFQLSSGLTVCWGGSYRARDTTEAVFFGLFNAARTSSVDVRSVVGDLRVRLGATEHTLPGLSSNTIYDNKTVHSAVTFKASATTARLYAGGVEQASVTTTDAPADFGADPYFCIGNSVGLNTQQSFDGTQVYFYVFDGELLPIEIQSIARNPWQLFAPLPRRMWVPSIVTGVPVLSAATVTAITSTTATPRVTLTF